MATVLSASSFPVGGIYSMDVAAQVKEALREVRQPTVVRVPHESKGKRPRRREDGQSGQSTSPPKSAAKKPPKHFDSHIQKGRSVTPKKHEAGKETPAQAPGKANSAILRKQDSAPVASKGPVPRTQQPKNLTTGSTPAASARQTLSTTGVRPSTGPKPQQQPAKISSAPASISTKALQEAVLTKLPSPLTKLPNPGNKWAGPGFSLPPTPDALPMPSPSLLASKPKRDASP